MAHEASRQREGMKLHGVWLCLPHLKPWRRQEIGDLLQSVCPKPSGRVIIIIIIIYPWYFILGVLKLANVKMYVGSGYSGDLETVNVLARHAALKR